MEPLAILAAAIAVVAVLLVGLMDQRGEGPLSDEWMYQWSAQQLAAGHLRIWPELSPLSLVQGAAAAAMFHLGAPLSIARLTEIPFLLLCAVTTAMTAMRLGATRSWAAVTGTSVALSPVLLFTATGLLSDAAYLGLLGTGMYLGVRWLQNGAGLVAVVGIALLAGLQRQFGVELLAALGLVVMFRRERRALPLGVGLVVAGAISTALLLAGPPALRISGVRIGELASNPVPSLLLKSLGLVFEFGPMLGLAALPLAMRLWLSPAPGRTSRWSLVPFVLGVATVTGSSFLALRTGGSIFPGPILDPRGLGALDRIAYAGKPSPYPAFLALVFMLIVIAAAAAALLRCSGRWVQWDRRGCLAFLLLLAGLQVAPLLIVGIGDRYFMPIVLVLAPVLALMASSGPSRWPKLSAAWAVGGLMMLVGVYVVGEADFLAWHNARHQLAIAAYAAFSIREPNLGEDGSVRYIIPIYERTGVVVPPDNHPELLLEFAAASDPRPGVAYGPWPVAGKVVAVCLRDYPTCNARLSLLHLR